VRVPATLLRLLAVIVLAGIGTAGLAAALIPQAADLATAHEETASLPELNPLAQRSVMYAADGSVMAVLKAEENRKPVALGAIPQPMIDTVLAVEDAEFYHHRGVNARSLIRALLANVSAGGVTQGGSTITQQVVKNALLTPKRDANRKVKEAIYAIRLERTMTKDEILERYLNTVYFGNGAYGVQAAAELYFGTDVGNLDYPQAAFLTGLIRNPVGYDPFRFPARAAERRRIALNRLVDVGKLTRDQADLIDATPIPTAPQVTQGAAPPEDYFVEEVKQQLLDDVRLGDTAQERYNSVFKGGLQIYTTFDPRMQQFALQARNDQLPDTGGKFTVALVALDPQTGAVRAMVGGPGFENAKFNLATQGIRQPGSSMKTFVLVAALEAGVRPTDIIDGTSPCRFPLPGGQPDYVISSEGGGVGPISKMITNSINCAFVRLGLIVGLDRVIDTARRMGVTAKLEPVPSMSIGSEEISPLEMASAYGVLAADGGRHPAYYVDKVLDPAGDVVFQHDESQAEQAVDPSVARMATQMLQGVVKSGTGKRAALADRPVAGKTGTSQDNADAWFVGYTPQLVTAVWMGAPVGRIPMRNVGGINVTGGSYPAKVWHEFMQKALEGQPVLQFGEPPELPERRPARLYLPYVECGYEKPKEVAFGPTTSSTVPDPRRTTTSTSTTTTTIDPALTTTTLPRNHPVPSVPTNYIVMSCGRFSSSRPHSGPTTAPPPTGDVQEQTPTGAGDDPSITVSFPQLTPQGGPPVTVAP
jgi:penicillin-binding protein 1A